MPSTQKTKVLVVGGAGYVGSATCAWLLDHGHEVWVLDDLSTGLRAGVLPELREGRFVKARAGDRAWVLPLLERERFDAVMHFAARSLVAESVAKPQEYFENNVIQTRALLDQMLTVGIRRFIFSSTCAVYGNPGDRPISESFSKQPLSPYGETKLEVEKLLEAYAKTHRLQSVALRYFNAAGAEPRLRVGECHEPETHLIPRVLQAAAAGRAVEVFGTDYPTPDGTCVRDYVHVTDLARAHVAAMERLLAAADGGRFEAFNLGSERGYSVREVIDAAAKTLGRTIAVTEKPRRPGDPPRLVADSSLARRELGFRADYGLSEILDSAAKWEQKRRLPVNGAKAVFLDRDGTINEDPGYLSEPDDLKLLPQVGEALAALKKQGYLLVVVSNQSGVGRGLIPLDRLPVIHARLDEMLSRFAVKLDHYELCVHRPEDGCDCRKPQPKLLLDAARRLGIDLARSYMIGDKGSDILAGRAAGCRGAVLVRTGHGVVTEAEAAAGKTELAADFTGSSLLDAANWILGQENAGP